MRAAWIGLVLAFGCSTASDDDADPFLLDGGHNVDGAAADQGGLRADLGVERLPDAALGQPDAATVVDPDAGVDLDAGPDPDTSVAPDPDASVEPDPDASIAPDPLGSVGNPIRIDELPYSDQRSTDNAPASLWNTYSCAPDTNEGGAEFVYVLDVMEAGTLSAGINEMEGDGVDVDVHLLSDPRPNACLARDHDEIFRFVEAGTYYIAVDTWVNGAGEPQSGPYRLDVSFRPRGDDLCTTRSEDVRMAWRECANACCVEIDGDRYARLPCVGAVVKEAHLVTVDDDGFDGDWPSANRDGLDAHYALSQMATGYVMNRREAWAPEGEGGSRWGQAAFFRPLPVIEESWYVNMFWTPRPAAGTRMIVRNPANGRAVVAAAGYETGPGNPAHLGGVTEEIHHYLGTGHLSELVIGTAEDQTLPFGPIDCD